MAKTPTNVAYQVMWNRLISVVEEQAQALVRTAFSTSVREAGDLSAGVYDVQGNMLAQAVTGTPGHVNAMADAVAHFIRRIGRENIADGDVYITNDPWEGTGHLHDITMVTPSFYKGQLVGFFACTAHIVDIGGRGFGADAQSVYEEGLYIPIMKFADEGVVDKTLVSIIRGNVREPDQLIGDIYALTTCNEIGHRRLVDMMAEFDLSDLLASIKRVSTARWFMRRPMPATRSRSRLRPKSQTMRRRLHRLRLQPPKTQSSTHCIPRPWPCAISLATLCPTRFMMRSTKSCPASSPPKGRAVYATSKSACAPAQMHPRHPMQGVRRC